MPRAHTLVARQRPPPLLEPAREVEVRARRLISLVQSHGFRYPVWAISPGRVDTPMRDARYPNDTPGSRLSPENIGFVVRDIMDGTYASGANVIIRKIGADPDAVIEVEEEVNPWRDVLRVGQPLTI